MASYTILGVRILLIHLNGALHAYEDRCPHQGIPLSKGQMKGTTLTCWAHGWQFDVGSGCGVNPKDSHLSHIPISIEDQSIYVDSDVLDQILKQRGRKSVD